MQLSDLTLSPMYKKTIRFIFLMTFLTIAIARAQEPAEPYGHFAKIKDRQIYYEESGNGMPLILLNPFTQTSTSWKPFIPYLSKYYHVVAVDIPGNGRSDAMDTSGVYSFRKAGDFILGLIDFLQLDSVNIIGPSATSAIALYIATIRPARVKSMIIIGGQAYFSEQTRKTIASWGPGFEDSAWLAASIKTHGKEKGTLLLKQLWNFRNVNGDPPFTPEILSTITARTLIIHGDNDDIVPLAQAIDMYNNINKKYLWIVPNGGHLPYMDTANQIEFLQRATEFLNKDWDKK
jgi:pimeloyl-ACP methyl ester carboxylesterase